MSNPKIPIGLRIKSLISLMDMNQYQLAGKAGIDPSYLSRALRGDREIDSMITPIQTALGVDLSAPITIHPDGRVDYSQYTPSTPETELLEAA